MLLQQQQTTAPGTFETLCGNFLSQWLKRTVVGGKEKKKKTRSEPLIIPILCMKTKMGRVGDGLRHSFKALIELPLQLLRLIVAVVCLSVA